VIMWCTMHTAQSLSAATNSSPVQCVCRHSTVYVSRRCLLSMFIYCH